MKETKRILALCLVLFMVIFAFAACTSNDEPPAATEAPAETDTAEDTGDEEAPAGGGILRLGAIGLDGVFNPITQNQIEDSYVTDLIFDGLISNDATGAPVPLLGTWEISEDYLTYTFTLFEGITFSDGEPMTTADVAFTYRTMAHPDYDGPRNYAVSPMVGHDAFRAGETDEFPGVEIIDDLTIAFHFYEASPANIWSFEYGILPVHIYDFEDWSEFVALERHPIGSGRFIFEEYRPMEFVRLSANTNHWNPDRIPQVDGILIIEIPNEILLDALAAGDIDFAQPSTTIDNYNALQAQEGTDAVVFLGNGFQFMTFNTESPQLEDHRVRQALMYALDRQAFVDITLGAALGSVGMAPISPASWAFPDGDGLNDYAFNMERAQELMAEAGFTPGDDGILVNEAGVRMELTFPVYTEVEWPGVVAGLAADSWGQLGVDLNIELTDFNTVIARTMTPEPGEKEFDVYVLGFSLAIDPDPSGAIFDYDAFMAGGFNASGFFHARAQELIAEGRTEFDQDARAEIYAEWAELMNYYLPSVIMAYRNELWAVNSNVNGMVIDTFLRWPVLVHEVTLG